MAHQSIDKHAPCYALHPPPPVITPQKVKNEPIVWYSLKCAFVLHKMYYLDRHIHQIVELVDSKWY